jgi:hypothetical protein
LDEEYRRFHPAFDYRAGLEDGLVFGLTKLLFFYLPFLLCFIVPNLVKLAPWSLGQHQILFYWWIASAPIVTLLLARLWAGTVPQRICAGVLLSCDWPEDWTFLR